MHNKPLAAVREQLSEADGSAGREDKAQPGGRDAGHGQPGRGYGGGWVRGTPVLPGEGTGRGGRGARYLGAVEVTAMRVREPARPAGALVDGHVPQLHVHPHDPSAPRERVSPSRGWRGASPCPPRAPHPEWPSPSAASGTAAVGLVRGSGGQWQRPAVSPNPRTGVLSLGAVSGEAGAGAGAEAAAPGCEFCPSRGVLMRPIGK